MRPLYRRNHCDSQEVHHNEQPATNWGGRRSCFSQEAYQNFQQCPQNGIVIANYTAVPSANSYPCPSDKAANQLAKLNASIEVLNKLESEHGCIRAADSLNPSTPSRWETWKSRTSELNTGLYDGSLSPEQAEKKVDWLVDRMRTTALTYIGQQTHRSAQEIDKLITDATARQQKPEVAAAQKAYDLGASANVDHALVAQINGYRDLLIEAKRSVPHALDQSKAWDKFITERLKTLDQFAKKDVLSAEDRTQIKAIIDKDSEKHAPGSGVTSVADFIDWSKRSKAGEMRVNQSPNNKGVYYVELPDKAFDCSWNVEVTDTHNRQDSIIAGRTENGRLFKLNVDTPGQEVTFKAVKYGYYRDRCGNCCQCVMDSKTITLRPSETTEAQVTQTSKDLIEALGRQPKVVPARIPEPTPANSDPKPHNPPASEGPKPSTEPKVVFEPKAGHEAIQLLSDSMKAKSKALDIGFLADIDKLAVDLDQLIERKKAELAAGTVMNTEVTETIPAVKKYGDKVLEVLGAGTNGFNDLTKLDIKDLLQIKQVVTQLQALKTDFATLQQMTQQEVVTAEQVLKTYDELHPPKAASPNPTTTTPTTTPQTQNTAPLDSPPAAGPTQHKTGNDGTTTDSPPTVTPQIQNTAPLDSPPAAGPTQPKTTNEGTTTTPPTTDNNSGGIQLPNTTVIPPVNMTTPQTLPAENPSIPEPAKPNVTAEKTLPVVAAELLSNLDSDNAETRKAAYTTVSNARTNGKLAELISAFSEAHQSEDGEKASLIDTLYDRAEANEELELAAKALHGEEIVKTAGIINWHATSNNADSALGIAAVITDNKSKISEIATIWENIYSKKYNSEVTEHSFTAMLASEIGRDNQTYHELWKILPDELRVEAFKPTTKDNGTTSQPANTPPTTGNPPVQSEHINVEVAGSRKQIVNTVGNLLTEAQIDALAKAPLEIRQIYLSVFTIAKDSESKEAFDNPALLSSNRDAQGNPPANGILNSVSGYIKPNDKHLVIQFTAEDLKPNGAFPVSAFYRFDLDSMEKLPAPSPGENILDYLKKHGKVTDSSEKPIIK